MSSTYSTLTASVVQISASGALGSMLTNLSSRTVDPFASSFYSTKAYALGVERDAHEEPIHAKRKNVVRSKFEISRAFDLISNLVLVIDVPGLSQGSYVENLGPALIESATLSMGGHALARLTGGLLHAMEELGGNPGKSARVLYDVEDDRTAASRLYVPMSGFWFTKSLSKALNLVGSSFQRAYLDVTLNKLEDCITKATEVDDAGNITVLDIVVDKNIPTDPMLGAFTPVAGTDLVGRVTLDSHGVTLNEADREVFAAVNNMTLMDELHHTTITVDGNSDTDLTSFAKNLVFEVILGASTGTRTSDIDFNGGLDTISLLISGQQRFPENMEAGLYNTLMPFLHHSQVPEQKGIHSLPFSMYPEDTQIADSHINMSKLDSVTLRLTSSEEVRVEIFCLAYNILVQQRGMKARFFV